MVWCTGCGGSGTCGGVWVAAHCTCAVVRLVPYADALSAAAATQGPIRRMADAVEQAVQEQVMYVQRAAESERAGEWNADVSTSQHGRRAPPPLGQVSQCTPISRFVSCRAVPMWPAQLRARPSHA